MKRIDLHIHTLPSNIDERFSFDESVLVNHVKANGLAGIAVTNHNLFDRGNYERTVELFPGVAVLPGIEVSVRSYHVLVIADPADIDDFENRCQEVPDIGKDEDGITKAIYTDTDFNRDLGIVGQEFDFQKSDIMNAISGYGDNKITIQKSGKEIKDKKIPDFASRFGIFS